MKRDFTLSLVVGQSPRQVFNAVLNVRQWWTGFYSEDISGQTRALNDEFTFRAGDGAHFSRQKLIELIPHERVVWLVTQSELTFVEKRDEWNGTRITFDIKATGNKTRVRFAHKGLSSDFECYDSCSSAWAKYLHEKLLALITSTEDAQITEEG